MALYMRMNKYQLASKPKHITKNAVSSAITRINKLAQKQNRPQKSPGREEDLTSPSLSLGL